MRPFELSFDDYHLTVCYDRVDTAIGTSRFATGSAMAYSNSYRLALILVGPVTTDTASFDHIGACCLRIGRLREKLLVYLARDDITAVRSMYSQDASIGKQTAATYVGSIQLYSTSVRTGSNRSAGTGSPAIEHMTWF